MEKNKIINRVLKVLGWILKIVLGLALLVFILLNLPPVQTYLAKKSANYLTEKSGYEVIIDKIDISWLSEIEAENVSVKDKKGNLMIEVPTLVAQYDLIKLLKSNKIEVDFVNLTNAEFRVGWYKGYDLVNISQFVKDLREMAIGKKKKGVKRNKISPFYIAGGNVSNGTFHYFDERKDTIGLPNYFDYNHFTLDSIHGDVSDFKIYLDSISFDAKDVVANHTNSHLEVHELDTKFLYCNQKMLLDDLNAYIGSSIIKDSISFEYASPASFSDFNRQVRMVMNLDSTHVTSKDLKVFIPQVSIFQDQWDLSGNFHGFVSDFKLKDMNLKFGKKSVLNGDIEFVGLPKISETLMNLKFQESKVTPSDIRQYLRSESFYQQGMVKFGNTRFEGAFRGFVNNFVSHGTFDTQLGHLDTDVNFVINQQNSAKTTYSGILKTNNFDLGKYLGIADLGKTDLNVEIKKGSKGFKLHDANVILEGKISNIEYKKYKYQNINLDANLSNMYFSGALKVQDENLNINTRKATLDLREEGKLDIVGSVETMNLKKLGFFKDSVFIKGDIKIDVDGLDIETLQGTIDLRNADAYIVDRNYNLDGFKLNSTIKDGNRSFVVNSSFFDVDIVGDYKFKTIINDFPVLIEEYLLYFENDQQSINNHYAHKDSSIHDYNVTLTGVLKDVNGLISLLDSNIEISNNTAIHADLKRGHSSVFNFKSSPEYFKYQGYEFYNNEMDINTSKLVDTSLAVGSVYISSDKQRINGRDYFERSDILLNIDADEVNFVLKTNQNQSNNYLFLKGKTDFYKDSVRVTLGNSYLHILEKDWNINDNNEIIIYKDQVVFQDVMFNNKSQLLSLNGVLSKRPEDNVNIKLRDFDSRNLKGFLSVDVGGLISGDLQIKDGMQKPEFKSSALVESLVLLGDTIGDIKGKFNWNTIKKKAHIDADLIKNNNKITHMTGTYSANDLESPLDIDFIVNDADFSILETFMLGYATHFKGIMNGGVNLSGTIEEPNWQGKIITQEGGFKIEYFQTSYTFSDEFIFDKEKIYVNNLRLIDDNWKTKGLVNGGISHHWFRDFSANATLDLNNTFVLNTQSKDNSLYYGTAFGTGKIQMDGPFSALSIWSDELISEEGTKIYVPLDESSGVSQKDYITFVTPEEKLNVGFKSDKDTINISGIDMDINFNITKDAYFEIIFDIDSDDKITGVGDGNLNMKVDTRGDFNMFGTYNFHKGAYNFRMLDWVDKKFDIKKGSKITWDGSPYQGNLAINAVYRQMASLENLVDSNVVKSNPDIVRRVPVDINLDLFGKLLAPDVKFDISIEEYSSTLETIVADLETKMTNDDQNRNKQVFSLIVLGQFSPQENIGNLSSGTADNLSELFSNQFSSWISDIDENLDVAIDFSGYDSENSNVFSLKLSYSLLDGRLRVSRDGSFTNLESSNDLANMFGEWTVEYLITEDGKIRMKAFNKNSTISSLNSSDASTNTTYGFSIMHNKSFDRFTDLFRKEEE